MHVEAGAEAHRHEVTGGDPYTHVGTGPEANRPERAGEDRYI